MPYSATIRSILAMAKSRLDFKLGKRIGSESAYGAVFNIQGDRKRVVKLYKPYTLKVGRKEIAVAVRMGREGVGPKVHKAGIIGKSGGRYVMYMIMDKIDGDLYTMMKKCPILYAKRKKEIKKQIEKLITKMHKLRFVHADLKDDNVGYVLKNRNHIQIYIIDFGFATLHDKNIIRNKNLATAIVRAYREQNYSYEEIKHSNGFPSMQRRFLEELRRDPKLKKTKVMIDIEKLYSKTKHKPFSNLYINTEGQGPMHYELSNHHWIIFNKKEVWNNGSSKSTLTKHTKLSNSKPTTKS